MNTLEIPLSAIAVPPERLRALRPETVDALAESMAAQGQLQPILVRPRDGRRYWLVAGRHRLEAGMKLKWQTIRCEAIENVDDDQAELAEIDENLCRAELTPAELAMHTARRKELYEKVHPATKHGAIGRGRQKSSQVEKSFVNQTATKTGKGRSTVARDVTRGNKVKVLADVVGTSLDQGQELDALARLPEEDQRALAARAKAGEKVSAGPTTDSVKEAADRAERTAAAKTSKSTKPSRAQNEFADQPPKAADVKAATEVSQQVADLVEQFQEIDLSSIARMTGDERAELMTQLARATTWVNKAAIDVAVSGGAKLGVLAAPDLRYEALAFMRSAIARIEAELSGRNVPESAS